MSALATHFGYEFRSALRSPSLVLLDYLFPLGFYLLMGVVMIPLNPAFAEVMIPAMTIFAVMTPTVLGLPGPLVEAREAGVLRGYRVNGIPTSALLAMPAATTGLHAVVAATLIGVSAGPLFGVETPSRALAMVAVVLLAVFVFAGLGLLFGVVSSDSRMTVIWSQAIFLPSMLIGGMMVPLDLLPETMRAVSMFVPTTHLMQLAEAWAYGRDTLLAPGVALAALVTSGTLAYAITILGFSWEPRTEGRRLHPLVAAVVVLPLGAAALLL